MSDLLYELYNHMRCPKCGGEAYVREEDTDCWVAECVDCDYKQSVNPTYQLARLFPDWYDDGLLRRCGIEVEP